MKKILITGKNSYIGNAVESRLKEAGHEADVLDMIGDGWKSADFSRYDCIFHVAGIAHVKETKKNKQLYYSVNRDLAVETAQKAKSSGVKQFVFLSSMSVYGKEYGKITNDTLPKPKTNYGKSKLEAEQNILPLSDENFKVCVLRPPMIYGKDCKGNYVTLRKFALKLKIFPYVKNKRSMLYIENLCEFVRLIIENVDSGVFFPQNAEYTNTSEMVKSVAAAHGKKLRLIRGFGWAVKLLGLFVKSARKAFGNLTYDKSMSEYGEEYRKYTLLQSMEKTEIK